MANDLQELMDTMIMPAALPVLREACIMPALVATDFGIEAKEQFASIRVPLPVVFDEADDMDPVAGSSASDLITPKVEMVLDKWKYKQFQMNDKEMRETITSGVLPSAAEAAVKVLANTVNRDLWGLYRDIPFSSGTAGTTPTDKRSIVQARKGLQNQLVPLADRRLCLDTDAEANFIELFSDVDKTGSTEALVKASLGHKFGLDVFADQMAPVHYFGTMAGKTPLVNGAVAAGASIMNIDGGEATETVKRGDVFTVANVRHENGDLIQFVITEDGIAATGVINAVQFWPAAPVGGFADNAAITFVKAPSGSHYAINLAFHRDAFMFAARSLSNEESENSTISVAADPVTGIPLRLETWREPGKATRQWRFDILYGVQTIRRELAHRLHG